MRMTCTFYYGLHFLFTTYNAPRFTMHTATTLDYAEIKRSWIADALILIQKN